MDRNVIIGLVVIVAIVLLLCCCVVAVFVAFTGGCTVLGIGGVAAVLSMPAPYDIDERPAVPANVSLEDVWPRNVPGYRITQTHVIDSFADVALPRGAVSFIYDGPAGRVQTFAVQTASESRAWQLVDQVESRVKSAGISSRLSRSLPGKSAFVQWRVSDWEESVYGIVWTNGPWVFGVASSSQAARDAVAEAFPY